ncbi:hypothetical protein ARMGADRAFT_558932 [Armillaria gallica]|uniref:Uncharacterized protein n=1 Tax=Armillaria gallica TaxID=47427 RepID=A0A2H3CUL1_ARMGA|nr:hypothetical protein ARMGADRAFT_558932 [Armillaria gallica]
MTVLRPYRTPYRTVEHLQRYHYGTVTGDPYPSTTRNVYGRTRIRVRWASLVKTGTRCQKTAQSCLKQSKASAEGA